MLRLLNSLASLMRWASPPLSVVAVHTDRVMMEEPRQAGPVHVGVAFWKRLEMERILESAGLDERSRQLTLAMVMNRLVAPKSEHAMPDWIRQTALSDLVGVDLETLNDDKKAASK